MDLTKFHQSCFFSVPHPSRNVFSHYFLLISIFRDLISIGRSDQTFASTAQQHIPVVLWPRYFFHWHILGSALIRSINYSYGRIRELWRIKSPHFFDQEDITMGYIDCQPLLRLAYRIVFFCKHNHFIPYSIFFYCFCIFPVMHKVNSRYAVTITPMKCILRSESNRVYHTFNGYIDADCMGFRYID